jgi:TRAP-type C4-dicarboxylate transport system substrate-binding protein
MKKNLFLMLSVIVLVAAIILGGCAAPAPAPTPAPAPVSIELKFAYFPPPPAPISKLGFEGWGPEIEKATNGQVKVKYFGGSAMGSPADHYKLVTSGTSDISVISPEFTPGVFPLNEIANVPGLFPGSEAAAVALYRLNEKYTLDKELKDVKLLAISPTAPSQLHTKTKQVKTLDDLKGMKLAVTSATHAKTVELLGGSPVSMVEGDVYTALDRGMVDGRLHAWDSIVTWKTMEVTKYRTGNVNASLNLMMVLMNKNTWDKFPADIKTTLTGLIGQKMSQNLGKVYDTANAGALEAAKAYDAKVGNPEIYWLPPDEQQKWLKAYEGFADDWAKATDAKGLPGAAALKDIKAFVAEVKK